MKKFKLIALSLVMLFTLLLFVSPEVYAAGEWGQASDFAQFDTEAHVGIITDITVDTVYIQFTKGPASTFTIDETNVGLFMFDNTSTYIDFQNISNWEVDAKVGYNQITKKFNIDLFPVFNSQTVFITNIDNPISTEDLLSQIKAIDNEDGDISHLIEINDDEYGSTLVSFLDKTINYYDFDNYYIIQLVVKDSSNNTSYLEIQVYLKDILAPIITGTKNYNTTPNSKLNITNILNSLIVTDNTDWLVENHFNENSGENEILRDPSYQFSTINIKQDNYLANYNELGTYEIIFEAEDFSGNKSEYTVVVNVRDENPPVFTGPTEIIKPQTEILLLDDILELITVSDVEDPNVSYVVKSDLYTGNGHKKGSWNIVLEATDVSGNIATHTIKILVKDNIPPVFFVDKYFINVDQYIVLTREDIINLLIASGQVNINAQTNFNFMVNEYEGNEEIPGSYAMTVKTTSTDGTTNTFNLMLNVLENTTDEDDLSLDPDKNIFTDAWDWLFTPTKENGNFYNVYYIIIGFGIVFLLSGMLNKKRRYRRY